MSEFENRKLLLIFSFWCKHQIFNQTLLPLGILPSLIDYLLKRQVIGKEQVLQIFIDDRKEQICFVDETIRISYIMDNLNVFSNLCQLQLGQYT
jgi:hypothetical protein